MENVEEVDNGKSQVALYTFRCSDGCAIHIPDHST
jgi:hypothetical protein